MTRTRIAERPWVSLRGRRNSSSRKRRLDVSTWCSVAPSSLFGSDETQVFAPARYHEPAGFHIVLEEGVNPLLASATQTSAL